jgi:hypothetical protein
VRLVVVFISIFGTPILRPAYLVLNAAGASFLDMAMTATDHNRLLGIFITIRGVLLLVAGIMMAIFMAGGGMLMATAGHRHDDQVAGAFMLAGGVIGGVVMLAMGFFDLYAASKIRKAAPVGRTLGIVVCALSILSFPLGTALGAYGLWFFFSDQGRALYGGSAIVPADFHRDAPPPNSWA